MIRQNLSTRFDDEQDMENIAAAINTNRNDKVSGRGDCEGDSQSQLFGRNGLGEVFGLDNWWWWWFI